MNLKFQAAFKTVGMFAIMVLTAIIISAVAHFLGTDALVLFSVVLLAFFAWIMYSINLSQLEFEKRLTKNDKEAN